jgi:hypothetical protein
VQCKHKHMFHLIIPMNSWMRQLQSLLQCRIHKQLSHTTQNNKHYHTHYPQTTVKNTVLNQKIKIKIKQATCCIYHLYYVMQQSELIKVKAVGCICECRACILCICCFACTHTLSLLFLSLQSLSFKSHTPQHVFSL